MRLRMEGGSLSLHMPLRLAADARQSRFRINRDPLSPLHPAKPYPL